MLVEAEVGALSKVETNGATVDEAVEVLEA
jgi:hypothetical protein